MYEIFFYIILRFDFILHFSYRVKNIFLTTLNISFSLYHSVYFLIYFIKQKKHPFVFQLKKVYDIQKQN
jgi:hypothetical protein